MERWEEPELKQKKVLLTAINAKYIHSNLAVYSLKANAGRYAGQVEIAEYTINHRREEILQGIYGHAPDIVGFSCYIWNIEYVLAIAADVRSILPHAVILLGGPEVSYDAPQVLERNPSVDVIMTGEGEATFREFLECYFAEDGFRETVSPEDCFVENAAPDSGAGRIKMPAGRRIRMSAGRFRNIPGLCLRGTDGVVVTPPRAPLDMDTLVFPYCGVPEMENRIIYYETMRGCPFSCSYCLSSVEKGVRMRSMPLVLEEIQFFLDHGVKQVKFVDRTFNCHHGHAYQIWEYIGKHDNGITNFHFEIGGDLLREEDFELFRSFRPGLVQFEIGVQSTNPDTIRAIRRRTDLAKLAENLAKVRENRNIHQHVDLIAGLPCEDYRSFRHSFNEVYAMAPDQLQLGFLKILKGSDMERKQEEYGIKHGSFPPYEVLSTRWISYDDIQKLKRVEEMVEIYYNSFQFQATVALLEQCHPDACSLFESLENYYAERGGFGRKHSRLARYEWLWNYTGEYFPQWKEEFRQTLTYDLYLREYVKSPPAFVRAREKEYTQFVRLFLDEEEKQPALLPGYGGFTAKQMFHMVYVDEFTLDIRCLLEDKQVRKVPPYSLVFDYKKRDPLNHSARICVLEHL